MLYVKAILLTTAILLSSCVNTGMILSIPPSEEDVQPNSMDNLGLETGAHTDGGGYEMTSVIDPMGGGKQVSENGVYEMQ
jgi:hypothetical protein